MDEFFGYMDEEVSAGAFCITALVMMVGYWILFSSVLNLEFNDLVLLWVLAIPTAMFTTYVPFYIYYKMERRRVRKLVESEE